MGKFTLLLMMLFGTSIGAEQSTLWDRYWTYDLRQYPTTHVEKYFKDLVFLAGKVGPVPESTARIRRKDYTGKKVRVLFLIPFEDTRYPFELAARFNMEYDVLPVSLFSQKARSGPGFKDTDKKLTGQLLDAIEQKKFDVIVTRNFDGTALLPDERARMENWFHNGMGWVDMGVSRPMKASESGIRALLPLSEGLWIKRGSSERLRDHFISSGLPGTNIGVKVKQKCSGELLLHAGGDPALAVKNFGQGRIVSYPFAWTHDDAQYALLMKSIIWAAHQNPDWLVVTAPKQCILSRNDCLNKGIPVQVRTSEAMADSSEFLLHWELYHESGTFIESGKIPFVLSGKTPVRIFVKPTGLPPAGNAILYYSIADKKKQLLDWGQISVDIIDPLVLSKVEIPELFDRNALTFHGGLHFTNRGEKVRNIRYTLSLSDSRGRRLPFHLDATAEIPPGKESSIGFRLPCNFEYLSGPMGYLWLTVFDTGAQAEPVILRKIPFFAPRSPAFASLDWQCGVWGLEPECNVQKSTPWTGLSEVMAQTLRNYGVNTIGDGVWKYPDDLIPVAKEGFFIHTEYISTLFGTWSKFYKNNVFQPKPAYIPPWREKGREIMGKQIERVDSLRKLGVVSYACDEEPGLGTGEVCFSEESRKEFEKWALNKYGSLKQINEKWGTSFLSEKEIRGILLNDALRRNPGNPAQWMDFRFFMEDCYNGAMEDYAKIGRSLVPDAFFGYGAGPHTEVPNQGHNRARLGKTLTSCIEYLGPFFRQGSVFSNFDVLRSRHLPMLISVAGYPYHLVSSEQQYPICTWYTALHEGHGIIYYAGIHPSLWAKLDGTGAPNGATSRIADANADLLNGIGKLILSSVRSAKIGIYYSRPSLYAWAWRNACNDIVAKENSAEENRKMAEALRDDPGGAAGANKQTADAFKFIQPHGFAAFRELASGSGFGYDVVFEDQLLSGELARKYKILLLPGVICLSKAEFLALKEFVQNGGLLVADLQTGIYDESGRPNPSLPEVEAFFGISRKNKDIVIAPVTARFSGSPDDRLEGFTSENLRAVASAIPLAVSGTRPFAVIRTIGKGKTLYLNTIPKRGGVWMQWAWDPVCISPALRHLFTRLGMETGLPRPPVSELENTDIVSYDRGNSRYLFLSRGYETSTTKHSVLNLSNPVHLYDMRGKIYLGHSSSLSLPELPAGYTAAYSLLNYKPECLEIGLPESVFTGAPVKITIRMTVSGQAPESYILNCSVYDPSGRKEPRFSRNIEWAPANNQFVFYPTLDEKPGRWKIVVKEVASGITAEQTFELKNGGKQ